MHQELLSFDRPPETDARDPDEPASIQERFEAFLATAEGAAVYREFVRIALELRAAGWEHYGAKSILEVLRFHWAVGGPANDARKINNIYGSRMARKAMEERQELVGFFEVRELKSI